LLCGFALVHDIGHGPFSHQIEPVLRGGHHARGIRYLYEMKDVLKECGLQVDELVAMFDDHSSLGAFVSDRNMGMDKLDYLMRDALHIGFDAMPDAEKILLYSDFENGGWRIEEKFVEDFKRIQKFYSYLHQHGYLNKTALSVQRIFQRAVQENLEVLDTEPSELWEMTDFDIWRWLYDAPTDSLVRELTHRLETRAFHRTFCVIKPAGYGYVERASEKPIAITEWEPEQIRRFCTQYNECDALRRLENYIARSLGYPPGSVLFAAMPYFEKILPKDMTVFSKLGQKPDYQLFENDAEHHASLKGDYYRTFSIRLIVPPEMRKAFADQAGRVIDLLLEAIQPIPPA
jgi:HD superfamily phosphohydrolase